MKKLLAGIAMIGAVGLGGLAAPAVSAGTPSECVGRRVDVHIGTQIVLECVRVRDLPDPQARYMARKLLDDCDGNGWIGLAFQNGRGLWYRASPCD